MLGRVSRALRNNVPGAITVLRRPQDMGPGKPKGFLATEPAERAEILRLAWGPITDGNVADLAATTRGFMDKCAAHIPRLQDFVVEDITVESFKATCQKARKSAAALDGWTAADYFHSF